MRNVADFVARLAAIRAQFQMCGLVVFKRMFFLYMGYYFYEYIFGYGSFLGMLDKALWNGTERNRTERNRTERNETKRNETQRNETEWNETERNEPKRNRTESNGTERNGTQRNRGIGLAMCPTRSFRYATPSNIHRKYPYACFAHNVFRTAKIVMSSMRLYLFLKKNSQN